MSHSILIVDDDPNISEILEFNLKNEGYDVVCSPSAEDALTVIPKGFSVILLDVMMSGMSGYKLVESLRKEGDHTPIIFITAKDTENDLLTAFSVGGDDYISKPFSLKEVIARVKAIIRRNNMGTERTTAKASNLVFENMIIDTEAKEVTINNQKVALTKTELEILILLASHPDRIFSREDIIDRVWTDSVYVTERTVDVHITRLRKKLGDYAGAITNKTGYGYRFNTEMLL
ncbi:response regulator transcription factor [Porphyromonas sp.]|uniref:response regulator transcription factor n=1 Tax=Porphyromonas sp. TaxID=1924944 RepID=UPI0026DB3AAD|nr:response regulator transcription factor [Porphyromonas sp.]MDO4695272.1 response regulator transcription factor [Porphyromonas sp.]MDO4770690.1 response regulator transcription factor [Porphyromonas sp.]